MSKFKTVEEFYNFITQLEKKFNFWTGDLNWKKGTYFLYFRPNYSKINSGEDWNNAREAEKEFLEVQGAFLRLEPDSHAGLVRAELLLPKHLREELKKTA